MCNAPGKRSSRGTSRSKAWPMAEHGDSVVVWRNSWIADTYNSTLLIVAYGQISSWRRNGFGQSVGGQQWRPRASGFLRYEPFLGGDPQPIGGFGVAKYGTLRTEGYG